MLPTCLGLEVWELCAAASSPFPPLNSACASATGPSEKQGGGLRHTWGEALSRPRVAMCSRQAWIGDSEKEEHCCWLARHPRAPESAEAISFRKSMTFDLFSALQFYWMSSKLQY